MSLVTILVISLISGSYKITVFLYWTSPKYSLYYLLLKDKIVNMGELVSKIMPYITGFGLVIPRLALTLVRCEINSD
jgi:hypothetical protein